MHEDNQQNKPYELLGQIAPTSPVQSFPTEEAASQDVNQHVVTAYITTLYYSALANLYMQSTLPNTLEEVDSENPRLKIAFDRSYADFTTAKRWLDKNGDKFIATSSAKALYTDVQAMGENVIADIKLFYSK